MRIKNLRLFFVISLALAVVIRAFQAYFTTDPVSGFLKPEFKNIGLLLCGFVVAITVSVAIFSFSIRRCPLKLPRINIFMGLLSLLLAAAIAWNAVLTVPYANTPLWQISLLKLTGFLAALFFVAFAVKGVKDYTIPPLCFILPVPYWLVRLILIFTSTSSLALIVSTMFILAAEICVLLFMFELALLANQINTEKNYKKIAASGYCSVILCIMAAIPNGIDFVTNRTEVTTLELSSLALYIVTALFIYFFLRNHFSNKNLKKRKRTRKHSTKILPHKGIDQFYTG